jgi:protease I
VVAGKEWEGYQIRAEVAFAEVVPEDYLGIFFSGGRAPEYIRYDADLVRITRHFFAAGKPIASVCHGVEIPAYAGCLDGRERTTRHKPPAEAGGMTLSITMRAFDRTRRW